jgi:hypothetical protein
MKAQNRVIYLIQFLSLSLIHQITITLNAYFTFKMSIYGTLLSITRSSLIKRSSSSFIIITKETPKLLLYLCFNFQIITK